ncbi:MAG: Sapep family Mn(2+)-dependent dipeptidase [Clostridia bacterium]|nr:Sapep family Mn(2+)-dependent dipeptidase [Clostridia bacterium]
MLEFTQNLYESNGFDTELDAEGGYLLSYYGEGKKSLGLFAHADVVPVGDDWILTSPFEPIEKDGYIIGRGAIDDKSAVVTSLFCARMLKELRIPFGSRLVMFTGAAEESGMGDIKNYLKAHTPPDFSLIADTAFPLYRGNKGRILLKATKNSAIGELKSFIGGKAGSNVAEATVRLKYFPTLYERLKTKENERISVKNENDEIVISAVGVGKHTALPEGSINAAALIAEVLCTCELLSDDTREILRFIRDVCSDYYGTCLGIENDDTEFGRLTFVNYQINADESSIELYFNIRHGLGISRSEIKERLTAAVEQRGFALAFLDASDPHIVPEDHPMLCALMDVYIKYTGKTNAEMYVNAGGTYAQLLPCAAEIGTSIGGEERTLDLPQGHGSVHQPDECISIDGLLNAIELTMLMLLGCDKQQED